MARVDLPGTRRALGARPCEANRFPLLELVGIAMQLDHPLQLWIGVLRQVGLSGIARLFFQIARPSRGLGVKSRQRNLQHTDRRVGRGDGGLHVASAANLVWRATSTAWSPTTSFKAFDDSIGFPRLVIRVIANRPLADLIRNLNRRVVVDAPQRTRNVKIVTVLDVQDWVGSHGSRSYGN